MTDNTDAIQHAGEIPADLREHIEAPEDTAALQKLMHGRGRLTGELFHTKPLNGERGFEITQLPSPAPQNMLQQIFEGQAYFQGLLGHDVSTMETQELANYVKDQVLALLDEGHEALAEVSWKPWAKDKFVNHAQLGGELADILCFLINLALAAGLTAEDFYKLWREKATRNIARQEKAGGYSQRQGKCPGCLRAIDDLKAKGLPIGNFGGVDYCSHECIQKVNPNLVAGQGVPFHTTEHANPAGTTTFGEN